MATVAHRPLARWAAVTPAARSIWLTTQPPKMSPPEFVSAGMATVCNVRTPSGVRGVVSDNRGLGRCTQLVLGHAVSGLDDLQAAFDHVKNAEIRDDAIDDAGPGQGQRA